jgi:pyrroline-5-carboxylate reductase
MAMQDRTIAFIGGGHITSIIVENLIQSNKMAGRQLIVSDPDPQKLKVLQKKFDVQTTARNIEAVEAAGFVFINVLPQVVQQILKITLELGNRFPIIFGRFHNRIQLDIRISPGQPGTN